MSVFYNEHDRDAARWLGNLAEAGLIPSGTIDGRDIQEVTADDVRGFRECHFFAGIGGWPYALRLAGFPATEPVWTGSCPCQPFSSAGKGKGEADPRHLWPVFRGLITECRPPTIFGEQVASKAGRRWLAGVRADLEALGYRFGAADLCAASAGEKVEGRIRRGNQDPWNPVTPDSDEWEPIVVGPPHIRQRLFWVADTQRSDIRGSGSGSPGSPTNSVQGTHGEREWIRPDARAGSAPVVPSALRMANARQQPSRNHEPRESVGQGSESSQGWPETFGESGRRGESRGVGDSRQSRLAGRPSEPGDDEPELPSAERAGGHAGGMEHAPGYRRDERWPEPGRRSVVSGRRHGFWSDFDLIDCRDEKARRIEPGSQCLVDGIPFLLADGRSRKDASRTTLLKGFGNAIVSQLAAEFIRAYMEAR